MLVESSTEGVMDALLARRCLEGEGKSRGPEGTRTFSRRVLRRRWFRLGRCSKPLGLVADAGSEGLRKVVSVSAGSVEVLANLRRTRLDSASPAVSQYSSPQQHIPCRMVTLTFSPRVVLHPQYTLVQMCLRP